LENIFIAFDTITPLFLLILLGLSIRRWGRVNKGTLLEINRVVFQVFLPVLLFYNIYSTSVKTAIRLPVILFTVAAILAAWALVTFVVCAIEKAPTRRGAMIQGIYRTNFAMFGLPVVTNLYGADQAGIPSFMVSIIIPLFNVLAVITLETFRGSRIKLGTTLLGILKNPLIIGSASGVLVGLANLRLPAFVESAVANVADTAMPLALIVLGGTLEFGKILENRAPLVITILGRIVVVPLLVTPIAILFGFRRVELATILMIFASPTSVSSYPMAAQMGSDGDLAAEAIVFTTLLFCVSIFFWMFGLMQLKLL
jgi:predicted permease